MNRTNNNPIEILLIEDNPGDIRLTQEAFKFNKIPSRLHVTRDGIEALDFLYRRNDFAESPVPDLILLDLNLPKKSGREVLAEIKKDENLRRIPVIVLTTSDAEEDIFNAYDLHTNCYITKPVDLDEFMKIIKAIEDFWFTIVSLPARRK